jgi:hypothetical protein
LKLSLCLIFLGCTSQLLADTQTTLSSKLNDLQQELPQLAEELRSKHPKFITHHDRMVQEKKTTVWRNLFEGGKITATIVLAAVTFGIVHDLITTQIDFSYFSDLTKTHHGGQTRYFYPSVFKSQSKVQYALLWGTITTLPTSWRFGILAAIAARVGTLGKKLTSQTFVKPLAAFFGTTLAVALSMGGLSFLFPSNDPRFQAVGVIHYTSYLVSLLGALPFLGYLISTKRYSNRAEVKRESRAFFQQVVESLIEHPESEKLKALLTYLYTHE